MRLYKFLILAMLATSLLVQGCLEEGTPGDTQHERDRQSAVADTVKSEYDQMTGQFVGTYNFSQILLTLDVVNEDSAGDGDLGMVPQPHLVGNLTVTPEVFVNDAGQPLNIPYPVTDGQYVGGNDLSLVVQEAGSPTAFHCNVTDLTRLDCNWYMNASTAPRASFTLTRVQPGEAATSASHFEGTYVGSSPAFQKITANFRIFLDPQTGSNAVPIVSVVGSFVLYPGTSPGYDFTFTDGEYDPISDILAIKISGDNPIVVDCAIQSSTKLHCTWIGTHGVNSYQDFDLSRASQNGA